MSAPQVSIDLDRLERNARAVTTRCAAAGISVFGVTKGACGMPQVARAMLRGGVAGLAESRFENIRRLRDSGITAPIMLLRSPPAARAEEVVATVDISLQSEITIIREISRIAERMGRVHDIMLMIDLGDLREGIWPSDLVLTVEEVRTLEGVRIAGVGTNLGCFGAIMPTPENLGQLVAHAYKVESLTGHRLNLVSGGASSSLQLLLDGTLPSGINNLRVGEAILQGGIETFRDKAWDELEFDACRLTADIIEVKVKPSRPIGKSGYDAFGNQPVFVDEGDRLRAIANIGREDVLVEGLTPIAKGVRVLGASSDHLLLDVNDAAPPPAVGDRLAFRMNYGALLAAMTSEYVEKSPVHDVEETHGRRMIQIVADSHAAPLMARHGVGARLEAMDYDVVEPADITRLPAGLMRLSAGVDRRIALSALTAATRATHSLGLIWIDAQASLAEAEDDDGSVLAAALGLISRDEPFQPQLSPENVVLVGLRDTDDDIASGLRDRGATIFSVADIDVLGISKVASRAIEIASAGTTGYHVCLHSSVTAFPGWARGSGGLTVRETMRAMEALAGNGSMVSISIAGLDADVEPSVVSETIGFALTAFGKR